MFNIFRLREKYIFATYYAKFDMVIRLPILKQTAILLTSS